MSTAESLHAIVHYTDPSVPGGVETAIGDFVQTVIRSGGHALIVAGAGTLRPRLGLDVVHEPLLNASGTVALRGAEALADGPCGRERVSKLTAMVRERIAKVLPSRAIWHLHNIATNTLHVPLTCALRDLVDARGHPHTTFAWTWDVRWAGLDAPDYRWFRQVVAAPWPNTQYLVASPARRGVLMASGYPADRVHMIRPSVDFSRTLGLTNRIAHLLRATDLLAADHVVLYPCRLSQRKSIEVACDVVEVLRADGLNVKLIVTGFPSPHRPDHSEKYFAQLRNHVEERAISSNVVFAHSTFGELTHHDIAGLYQLADAVLLTSIDEGFGLVGLEATLTDTPLLVSASVAAAMAPMVAAISYADGASPQEVAAILRRAGSRRAWRRRVAMELEGESLLHRLDALAAAS